MSRPPVKVSHSIPLNLPASSSSALPPVGSAKLPTGKSRGRSTSAGAPSPVVTGRGRSSSPRLTSTPSRPTRNSANCWSSHGKSALRSDFDSDITDFNLTPVEILQVAKLIDEASYSRGGNPQESLKTLIRRVRTGDLDNSGICDMEMLTSFVHYPSFSTSGFGTVGQPLLESTFNGTSDDINDDFGDQLPRVPNNQPPDFLDDFEKPEAILKLERLAKARSELKQQRLENMRLKRIAARNEILPPNLISSVTADVEAMADSLEKFYASPAFQAMKDPVPSGIPCPIAKRKEMVQIFENLEKISSTQFSTNEKIDEGKLEEYIQHLLTKTTAKANSVEKTIEDFKTSTKETAKLVSRLEIVKKV